MPEDREHLVDHATDGIFIGDVGGHRQRAAPVLLQLHRGLVEIGFGAAGDGNIGAGAREGAGNRSLVSRSDIVAAGYGCSQRLSGAMN